MKIFQNLLCNHFTRAAKSNPRHEVSWVVEFSSSKDSNAEMGKMKTHFIILMQFSEIHKSNKSYVKHNNSQCKEAKTTQKHICRDPVWGCTVWQTCYNYKEKLLIKNSFVTFFDVLMLCAKYFEFSFFSSRCQIKISYRLQRLKIY